jgi:hypothetical protein
MTSDNVFARLDLNSDSTLSKEELETAIRANSVTPTQLAELVKAGKVDATAVDESIEKIRTEQAAAAIVPGADPAETLRLQTIENNRLAALAQAAADAQKQLNDSTQQLSEQQREAQRIAKRGGRDTTDLVLDWAGDGDIAEVSRDALRGTFNVAGRAWEATKGTTRFLLTNPNAQGLVAALTGLGGALVSVSLLGPKIDEITKNIPLGGFFGSVIKIGLLVIGGIGGLAVGAKVAPAIGDAMYGENAGGPQRTRTAAGNGASPRVAFVGGEDQETTVAANEVLRFTREDAATEVSAQTGDPSRRSFGDLALVGGEVSTAGRHVASDVTTALRLNTFDRDGNPVTLTAPAPTTPGLELRMTA